MQNTGLNEGKARIKIAGRNINNFRYVNDTTLMAESEEELKSLLMKVQVESEKVGLKLNIQKTNIMASGPITSWEINGETVSDFIFLGSKITADSDCSHEIKRHTPWKESYDQPAAAAAAKSLQSCPTLCDPMDCRLLGFSVHGILQARILERVAISSFRGSSRPRD